MCVCVYAPDVCTYMYTHTDTVYYVLEIGTHQELPEKRVQTWRFGALSEGDCSVKSLQKSSQHGNFIFSGYILRQKQMKISRGATYPEETCYCGDVCAPRRYYNVADLVDRPY